MGKVSNKMSSQMMTFSNKKWKMSSSAWIFLDFLVFAEDDSTRS